MLRGVISSAWFGSQGLPHGNELNGLMFRPSMLQASHFEYDDLNSVAGSPSEPCFPHCNYVNGVGRSELCDLQRRPFFKIRGKMDNTQLARTP